MFYIIGLEFRRWEIDDKYWMFEVSFGYKEDIVLNLRGKDRIVLVVFYFI